MYFEKTLGLGVSRAYKQAHSRALSYPIIKLKGYEKETLGRIQGFLRRVMIRSRLLHGEIQHQRYRRHGQQDGEGDLQDRPGVDNACEEHGCGTGRRITQRRERD